MISQLRLVPFLESLALRLCMLNLFVISSMFLPCRSDVEEDAPQHGDSSAVDGTSAVDDPTVSSGKRL